MVKNRTDILLVLIWLSLTGVCLGHGSHTHEGEAHHVSLLQVLGGMVYILVIFGVLAYLKSRKPKNPS